MFEISKIFLIVRPDHDRTTKYLYEWSRVVIDFARKKGFKIIFCDKAGANCNDVTGKISKINPDFILFNGHGFDDFICGHKNEILIQANKNEHLLKNKIIYARSCSTSQVLGPSAVKNGKAKAYIGYTEDFAFWEDGSSQCKPLEDKMVRPVFESSNIIPISLLSGKTAKEAHEASKKKSHEWLDCIRSSEFPFGDDYEMIRICIHNNMSVQKLDGNENAKIEKD